LRQAHTTWIKAKDGVYNLTIFQKCLGHFLNTYNVKRGPQNNFWEVNKLETLYHIFHVDISHTS